MSDLYLLFGSGTMGTSTGWDLSVFTSDLPTQTYRYNSVEAGIAGDVFMSDDGKTLFYSRLVGNTTNSVAYQYSLSVAWDLSTITYDSKSFQFGNEVINCIGMCVRSDGTQVYFMSSAAGVHQYTMSTAWDLSTASYDSKSYSPAEAFGNNGGIEFKPDGTKMYFFGETGGNGVIFQYTLSTAWDVSTATYDSKTFSSALLDDIQGLRFKPDGLTAIAGCALNVDLFRSLTLSTAWDISTASIDADSSMSELASLVEGFFIGDSGTKLFSAAGFQSSMTLPAAWSIEQILSPDGNGSYDYSAQLGNAQNIFFKTDGTKLYLIDSGNDTIYQYTLSTAWDLTTASYDSISFNTTSQDTGMRGLYFDLSGTRMFTCGITNDRVYRYTLGTAWDISTASYASDFADISGQNTIPNSVWFKDDGTQCMVIDNSDGEIHEYVLSTAWDLSTMSYNLKSIDTEVLLDLGAGVQCSNIAFNSLGTVCIATSTQIDGIYQFDLATPWDISTATYSGNTLYTGESLAATGIFVGNDGIEYYMTSLLDDTIYRYTDPS